MHKMSLLFGLVLSVTFAGCGQNTVAEDAPAPDAEQPYAEPVAPPAHTEAASRPDLKSSGSAELDQVALAEIADQTSGELGKVGNVTAGDGADKRAAIKQVAALADQDGEASEGDSPLNSLTGDPVKGKRLYAQCQACHAVVEGQNRVGPSLYGVVGRKAGAVESFKYSPAMANSGIVWTEDTIFAYLENSQAYLPGNRMFFPGVAKPQDRVDIIAYLKSLTE